MKGMILTDQPCERCGGEIWCKPKLDGNPRKRRFCGSPECQVLRKCEKHRREAPKRTCPACGESFYRRGRGKYCTPKCKPPKRKGVKGKWVRFERTVKTIQRKRRTEAANCDVCSKVYLRLVRSRRGGGNCCSKVCAGRAAGEAASLTHKAVAAGDIPASDSLAKYRLLQVEVGAIQRIGSGARNGRPSRIAVCASCSGRFVRDKGSCVGCCQSCRRADTERRCENCGTTFCKLKGTISNPVAGRWCSDECRDQGVARTARRLKRKYRTLRDSHKRGKHPGGVPFDPYDVFRRDQWKCRGCGVDTPRRLRGTYEPDAPELDHVIPLSRGGWHAPDNCQTLCRQCNADKGALLPDEWKGTAPKTMRLF